MLRKGDSVIAASFETPSGTIRYWVNDLLRKGTKEPTLVFLPGLTADHRLFDKQLEYFEGRCPCFVWDAPGHLESRPFVLDFDLAQKARWLQKILQKEGVARPVMVGQSMGGYVSQMYAQLFPDEMVGFVSIDSAPLQRSYTSGWEIWALKHVGPVYYWYPRKALLSQGSKGCSTTEYGQALMRDMIQSYDRKEYADLSGHGFRMLAEAYEADLPYELTCPVQLICGEKDGAGSAKSYNKRWAAKTGFPMAWLANAGHNANCDKPEEVNALIDCMLEKAASYASLIRPA